MGTVGLSFGNLATGSGFDVAGTVTSILAIESGIETPWKNQLTALQAQDTAFSTLGSDLSSLSTALGALTNFDGVMFSKLGSSSDTNVLSLSSASASSIAGSHTVTVTSLASTSSMYSDRVSSLSDTLSGSLEIQVGSSDQTITLDSSNNTLKTLAASINSGSYGVTASVVQDTTGYRLSLVSNQSGAAGQITLTPALTDTTNSNTTINFATGQTGADAVLNVDGLDTTSASNTVTTAIPGVTFQLLAAAPNTPVQVQITNDNSSVESAFATFVTAYNQLVSDMATQEGKDSSGNAEPLYGNPTLQSIQTQLSQALNGGSKVGGHREHAAAWP
jgi:flagellar hook-associated protein 2